MRGWGEERVGRGEVERGEDGEGTGDTIKG